MQKALEIMDTTLRDGEQTQGVSFTPAEKANIAKALLGGLKVDRIEVASARVSEGERQGVTHICAWAKEKGYLEQVEVLGFVDLTKSVDWVCSTGGKVINLLTKGSEKHCLQQLKKTPEAHWEEIQQTIAYAKQKGLMVNVYLEDWSNGYKDSPDYVFAMMDCLKQEAVERFMLPDTLGVMGPDQVKEAISDMLARYPGLHFDFHPHNDYGLATANIIEAVRAGVQGVHCTINCLGERAGNASLSEVAVNLHDRLGLRLKIDESQFIKLSEMVENFSGKRVSANAPIVGSDVFTQTAGIHADGDHKGGLYLSRLKPERFGRKTRYALGKMAGKASLRKNLEELGLTLSEENQKKLLKRIIELGDSKKEVTTEDLHFIVADVLESSETDYLKLLNLTTTSGLDLESTVSIRVLVQGEERQASGAGNGGFDAFMDALKKVTKDIPFHIPKLVDYEIRIPRGGKTNALTEAIITWKGEGKTFRTRGVDANQVFAAIYATLRMLNLLYLHRSK